MKKKGKAKIKTTIGLSRTKPLKSGKLTKVKKSIQKQAVKAEKLKARKPMRPLKDATNELSGKLSLWFLPARISMTLNGIYYFLFALISFYGLSYSVEALEPYLILSFAKDFQSVYLLEIAAAFALLSAFLFFHAAKEPIRYAWFYFFLVIFFLPAAFMSNLNKMQANISTDFYNYLYFDTLLTAVFWGVNLLSVYAYFKIINPVNKK